MRHQSNQIGSDKDPLDLLSTPALVGLAHVGGGLNGRNELQDQVTDTGDADNRGGNLAQDVAVQQNAADKDIDWETDQLTAQAATMREASN